MIRAVLFVYGPNADYPLMRDYQHDQNRFSIGLDLFINRFLQPRLVYRAGNGPPTDLPTNRAQLLLDMHMFF